MCNSHIAEARVEASEKANADRARELEEAKRAVAKDSELLGELLPGFPLGSASGPALATALEELVPERKAKFDVSGSKSFGRRRKVSGWSFHLGAGGEARMGRKQVWLVVTTEGGLHRETVVGEGQEPIMVTPTEIAVKIEGATWRRVLLQVLKWTGQEPTFAATREQRYLVECESVGLHPSFSHWSASQPD